jgi:uncharacterized protein (TIGR03437 family)
MKFGFLGLLALLCLTANAAPPLGIVTTQLPDGFAGDSYSSQLQAAGGTLPYTWSLQPPSLPIPGLQIGASTGVLECSPCYGFFGNLTFTVRDSAGQSAQQILGMRFWAHVTINNTFLPTAFLNTRYNALIAFSALKSASLTSGLLPTGITLQPDGAVVGTPTQAGRFTFSVTGTGYGGDSVAQSFVLNVVGPSILISLQPSFTLTAGQSATLSWQISGGSPPYRITVTGQIDGMSLASNSTSMQGAPTRAGTFPIQVAVDDQASTHQLASTTVTVVGPLSASPTVATARNNTMYSAPLTATGGVSPYTWRLTAGGLPAGLSLAANGQITGLVTAMPGAYTFTAAVTDSRASTASVSITLTVAGPAITTQSLPNAQVGAPYSQGLKVSGGTEPYQWAVFSGALPSGLLLESATGVISGTPSSPGSASFTVRVADAFTSFYKAALTITADGARFSVPDQTLAPANLGKAYQASLTFAGGVAPFHFVLDSGTLPDGLALSDPGIVSGTPTRKGAFSFTVRATDSAQPFAKANVTLQVNGTLPQFSAASLVNAASYLPGIAPGEYFSIFGASLAAATESSPALPLSTTLGSATVLWNGARLPLLSVSPGQINAQVPLDAPLGPAELTVTSDGVAAVAISVTVTPASPGLFQLSPGFLLAINEDGALNSSANPAPAGSVIVFYATGCGTYDRALRTGDAVPADRFYPLSLPRSLAIGPGTAEVLFAGAAPSLGTGLVQVNARVPDIAAGEWSVILTVGSVLSNQPHIFVSARRD